MFIGSRPTPIQFLRVDRNTGSVYLRLTTDSQTGSEWHDVAELYKEVATYIFTKLFYQGCLKFIISLFCWIVNAEFYVQFVQASSFIFILWLVSYRKFLQWGLYQKPAWAHSIQTKFAPVLDT